MSCELTLNVALLLCPRIQTYLMGLPSLNWCKKLMRSGFLSHLWVRRLRLGASLVHRLTAEPASSPASTGCSAG